MSANSQFAVAVHILTALAHLARRGASSSSSRIAESVNTNPVVVRRIVAKLAKAGLVICYQGKGGGIELGRSPEKITLLDIYEAMGEAPVFAFNPNRPNPKCPVSSKMVDVLKPVFSDVQDGVKERLQKMTLSKLVQKIR